MQAMVDAYQAGQIAKRSTGFTEEETALAFVGGESMYAYNWPYMWDNAQKDGSKVKGNVAVAPIVGPERRRRIDRRWLQQRHQRLLEEQGDRA